MPVPPGPNTRTRSPHGLVAQVRDLRPRGQRGPATTPHPDRAPLDGDLTASESPEEDIWFKPGFGLPWRPHRSEPVSTSANRPLVPAATFPQG